MEKKLFKAQSTQELEKCFPVLSELRPHLTLESFFEIYKDAHQRDGYEIVGLESGGNILALMGYRIISDFVRGKHIYIDDLVTSVTVRSSGLGAELLRHAEVIAKENNCKVLRLCTGVENERGVKFYEKNGWTKRAYAYTKKLV